MCSFSLYFSAAAHPGYGVIDIEAVRDYFFFGNDVDMELLLSGWGPKPSVKELAAVMAVGITQKSFPSSLQLKEVVGKLIAQVEVKSTFPSSLNDSIIYVLEDLTARAAIVKEMNLL